MWYVPTPFLPSYGTGWAVGCRLVQFGMFPLCPFFPMAHWDGVDSEMQA